ncbi:MAG TPA: DUF5668 domain-containing protein [Janthinobacterium sp.]|nr:DUF5668 domain-containing protein [Janthinobacterium sp.]
MRDEAHIRNRSRLGAPGQIVLGIGVIAMGFAFLLDNLGLVDFDFTLHFWPMLIILFGILKLVQSRHSSGYLIGAGLILVGGMVLLTDMGLIHIRWSTLWPLFIILLGLSVIFRSGRGRRWTGHGGKAAPDGTLDGKVSLEKAGNDDSVIDVVAVLGGYKRRIAAPDFRGGEITAIMGGCELDLRQSLIRSEAVLTVFAMCGGISLKVPADWTVILQGTPILGGFEEKTIEPPPGAKRLIIRGYAILGGLEVRN